MLPEHKNRRFYEELFKEESNVLAYDSTGIRVDNRSSYYEAGLEKRESTGMFIS